MTKEMLHGIPCDHLVCCPSSSLLREAWGWAGAEWWQSHRSEASPGSQTHQLDKDSDTGHSEHTFNSNSEPWPCQSRRASSNPLVQAVFWRVLGFQDSWGEDLVVKLVWELVCMTFLLIHKWLRTCSLCPSGFGFFHLACCPPVPNVLPQMMGILFFSLPSSTHTHSLSTHLLMDTSVDSLTWPLWIGLQ
jgi:hypothetical protein